MLSPEQLAVKNHLESVWAERLEGLRSSMNPLDEYAQFSGIVPREIHHKTEHGAGHAAHVWNEMGGDWAERASTFYTDLSKEYIWDHLLAQKNHLFQINWFRGWVIPHLAYIAAEAGRQQLNVIDFGGGIGTHSLLFHRIGHQIVYVDLPGEHVEFAQWRFTLPKYKGDSKDTVSFVDNIHGIRKLVAFGSRQADVVFSFTVLEHIPNLEFELRCLDQLLRVGGIVIHFVDHGLDIHHPMHRPQGTQFDTFLLDWGYKRHNEHVFTKRSNTKGR